MNAGGMDNQPIISRVVGVQNTEVAYDRQLQASTRDRSMAAFVRGCLGSCHAYRKNKSSRVKSARTLSAKCASFRPSFPRTRSSRCDTTEATTIGLCSVFFPVPCTPGHPLTWDRLVYLELEFDSQWSDNCKAGTRLRTTCPVPTLTFFLACLRTNLHLPPLDRGTLMFPFHL